MLMSKKGKEQLYFARKTVSTPSHLFPRKTNNFHNSNWQISSPWCLIKISSLSIHATEDSLYRFIYCTKKDFGQLYLYSLVNYKSFQPLLILSYLFSSFV